MGTYEKLSDNCMIRWKENFNLTNETYTQVSGYIFNNKNQLLIVKNNTTWTIPGGHPEKNETPPQTLQREVLEEASVTINNIKYLGAVEVIENNKTYYQLRYTAKVFQVLPFNNDWETTERLFVNLNDLHNYITWSKGVTFSAQIKSATKSLKD